MVIEIKMNFIKDIIQQNYCITSILACILLTMTYVASLYVWRSNLSRDHPSTIKRRFFSVSCMMIASPFFCEYFFTETTLKKGALYEHLGLRYSGFLQAAFLPLILTVTLFLGPLTMQFLSGIWKVYSHRRSVSQASSVHGDVQKEPSNPGTSKHASTCASSATTASVPATTAGDETTPAAIISAPDSSTPGGDADGVVLDGKGSESSMPTTLDEEQEPTYWLASWQDLVWVRNHFMAPLSEEWVFRACMLPLLLQCLEPMTAVFVGPLLFGIAHFHHMYEQMKSGYDFKTALMISMFQFTYTSLFGAYSAYLFLRTGHFIAPLVAHIFCNHMGFPNFDEIGQYPPVERVIIVINFLLGLSLWCIMLVPLTDPELYDNRLHWET